MRNFDKFSKIHFLQLFKFFYFLILFSFISKQLKPFKITQSTNQMYRHECTNMLLCLMLNFNLMKIFILLCFHVHKNSQINHFNSIFKSGKFWGVTVWGQPVQEQ